MIKQKLISLVAIFSILISSMPLTALHVLAREAPPAEAARLLPEPAQQAERTETYLLQLPMPDVVLPSDVAPVDVSGHYLGALTQQSAQVEAALQALQSLGLVKDYTFLPKSNAFSIEASASAEERLASLGTLTPVGQLQKNGQTGQDFQSQFSGAIDQAIRELQPRPSRPVAQAPAQNEAPAAQAAPAPAPRSAPAAGPQPQPEVPPAPETEMLVQLQAAADGSPDWARGDVTGHLAWLQNLGEVSSYAWEPDIQAFRVSATGFGVTLIQQHPQVAAVTPASAGLPSVTADTEEREASVSITRDSINITAVPNPTTPTIDLLELYDDDIRLSSITDTTTTLILRDSAGVEKTTKVVCPSGSFSGCDENWSFFGPPYSLNEINFFGFPFIVEPGDTVDVSQIGQSPFTMNIPNLTAMIDRAANTVTGQAPPNISSTDPLTPPVLSLRVRGLNKDSGFFDFGQKFITTDAAGNYDSGVFTYTSPTTGTLDLRYDTYVDELRYTNDQGNSIVPYRGNINAPSIEASLNSGSVSGSVAESQVPVTITLKSSSGAVRGEGRDTSERNGDFSGSLTDIYGNQTIPQPGDVIEVQASKLMTLAVVNLTAQADPVADTVTGQAPANIASTSFVTLPYLYVDVFSAAGDPVPLVPTDPAGTYVATRTVVGDFNSGDSGFTRYRDAEGDSVSLSFVAPTLRARGFDGGYFTDNYVEGYAGLGNTLVTLELARAGSVVASAFEFSSSSGFFSTFFDDVYGQPVDIEGGDTISMTAAGVSIATQIPDFSVTSDPGTDTVSGSTTATVVTDTVDLTQTLAVWPQSTSDFSAGKHVLVSGGFFSATNPFFVFADFTFVGTTTLNIQPGDTGHLRYRDAMGNLVYDDFEAPSDQPQLYVRSFNGQSYGADNAVGGNVPGFFDNTGTLTLRDSSNAIKAQVVNVSGPSFSRSFLDTFGNPVDIAAGDKVQADFGGQLTEVTVPSLSATSDPDTDTVSGSTSATVVTDTVGLTQTLAVWPNRFFNVNKHVLVSGGVFSATNPFLSPADCIFFCSTPTVNIQPGDTGYLRYRDAMGNLVYDDFEAPNDQPQLYVRSRFGSGYEADNAAGGNIPGFSGSGTVTLRDGSGTIKAQRAGVFAGPNFNVSFVDAFNNPVDIAAGDKVQADFGGQLTEVTVPGLSATSDPNTDIVSGNTSATVVTDTFNFTQTLTVWPDASFDSSSLRDTVLPDAAGDFTAVFTDEITVGEVGHLRYIDAAGNRVYEDIFTTRTAVENVLVEKDNNYVEGFASPSELVTVTLKSSSGAVKATAFDQANSSGFFNVNIFDAAGNRAIIQEGDEVMVQASSMVTIPVPRLTGSANVDTDVVSGEGPPNALVQVWVFGALGFDILTASTDGSGAYSADLRGRVDIQPGDDIFVDYQNSDGHTVYIRFFAGPKLLAQLNSYVAWGYAPAAQIPVTVTLRTGGGVVKATEVIQSEFDNFFAAFLFDTTGQKAMIAAGDVIDVAFGSGSTASLPVAGLTASVDAQADTISGTGPANDAVGVLVQSNEDTVTTDGAGSWSHTPGPDIMPGDQVRVRYINSALNETWLYETAPVVYVRADDSGPGFFFLQEDNYVSGVATRGARGNRTNVNITLLRSGSQIARAATTADDFDGSYAAFLYDSFGNAADIQAGDQVVVEASPTITVTVPDIQATTVNTVTNTLLGSGPANAQLGISVENPPNSPFFMDPDESTTVSTDSSGNFSHTFTNIDPGYIILIRYQNSAGHWIHTRFDDNQTGAPQILARWDNPFSLFGNNVCANCVSGLAGAANSMATISLQRGGSTLATVSELTNGQGRFSIELTDASDQPVDIAAGDVISLMAGGTTTSMTVAALTAQVNPDSGVLFGTGPANQTIFSSFGGSIDVGPDGSYYFANLGLGAGASGYIRYTTANGHATYLAWSAPRISVYENGDQVYGTVAPGVPVTVKLGQRAVISTTSNTFNGFFNVEFVDAFNNPILINPNDTVVVQAGSTITVPVTPISATIDTAADQVTGVGPANAKLEVDVGGCDRTVTTAADGSYTADTSGECDLQAGTTARVAYTNMDGNEVFIRVRAPRIRVNVSSDIVDGFVSNFANVSLMLQQGGTTYRATTTADADGQFSAFFTDAAGNVVDIVVGDTVDVTASPTTSVTPVSLGATIDAANESVAVTGPANASVNVTAFAWTGNSFQSRSKTVALDGSGNGTADFAGQLDLTATSFAHVVYRDAAGQETTFTTRPASSPLVTQLIQQGFNGLAVAATTFGNANDENLTPPYLFTPSGRSVLIRATGGALVVTGPDGSVYEASSGNAVQLTNPAAGVWKIQVEHYGPDGAQYAIVIGSSPSLFLPIVIK